MFNPRKKNATKKFIIERCIEERAYCKNFEIASGCINNDPDTRTDVEDEMSTEIEITMAAEHETELLTANETTIANESVATTDVDETTTGKQGVVSMDVDSQLDDSTLANPVSNDSADLESDVNQDKPSTDKAPSKQDVLGYRSRQGTGYSPDMVISNAIMNNIAGCRRFLGKGILKEEDLIKLQNPKRYHMPRADGDDDGLELTHSNVAVPLHGEDAMGLNQGAQRNATPMSALQLDRNVLFLFQDYELRGYSRERGGQYIIEYGPDMTVDEKIQVLKDTFYEALFAATILRLLARTEAYEHFARRCKLSNNVPTSDQLEKFINCMLLDYGASGPVSMTDIIGDQHRSSLPPEFLTTKGFIRFSIPYRDALRKEIDKFFSTHAESLDVEKRQFKNKAVEARDMVLRLLQDAMHSIQHGKLDKCKWFCQEIIGDVNEIFDAPFGEFKAEDMVDGWGSREALKGLQNNNHCVSTKKK